jgi:hypothetical protein
MGKIFFQEQFLPKEQEKVALNIQKDLLQAPNGPDLPCNSG